MKLIRNEEAYEVEYNGYFYHIEKALEGKGYQAQVTKNGRSEWLMSIYGTLKQTRENIEKGYAAEEYEGTCRAIDDGTIYDNFD